MGKRYYYVYILANTSRKVLYTGVTNNLKKRLIEHRTRVNKGFSYRYNVHDLMYFETFDRPMEAIRREKRIKKWYRYQKDALISRHNPKWEDLSGRFL